MDRDSLSAMLQKVRAMKARPSVTVSPTNVFAVASRVLERQRQREHRDERRESLAISVESADSHEGGSPVSVSSPSSSASDLDTISSLDQHSIGQGVPAPKEVTPRSGRPVSLLAAIAQRQDRRSSITTVSSLESATDASVSSGVVPRRGAPSLTTSSMMSNSTNRSYDMQDRKSRDQENDDDTTDSEDERSISVPIRGVVTSPVKGTVGRTGSIAVSVAKPGGPWSSVKPPAGPPPDDASSGTDSQQSDSDDSNTSTARMRATALAQRLEEMQRQAAMQFESMKASHGKEVSRLQRTLEDKFQLELAQKEAMLRSQMELEVSRRVAVDVAKSKSEFDMLQRATTAQLDEARRQITQLKLANQEQLAGIEQERKAWKIEREKLVNDAQAGYVSLYESITAKATELAAKMNEEVRQVMVSAAEEKQQAKLACVELTKKFLEEKAAYEAQAMAHAQVLVDQYKLVAEEASKAARDAQAALHTQKQEALLASTQDRLDFQDAMSKRCQQLVDAAKAETAEAVVALERERQKLAVLEVEVRRQFESHCRSFEARLRQKASRAVAMWRGIAMQALATQKAHQQSPHGEDSSVANPAIVSLSAAIASLKTPLVDDTVTGGSGSYELHESSPSAALTVGSGNEAALTSVVSPSPLTTALMQHRHSQSGASPVVLSPAPGPRTSVAQTVVASSPRKSVGLRQLAAIHAALAKNDPKGEDSALKQALKQQSISAVSRRVASPPPVSASPGMVTPTRTAVVGSGASSSDTTPVVTGTSPSFSVSGADGLVDSVDPMQSLLAMMSDEDRLVWEKLQSSK